MDLTKKLEITQLYNECVQTQTPKLFHLILIITLQGRY